MCEYPIINIQQTGYQIKKICKEKRISVKQIQYYLGLTCPQTIYHWFEGKSLPTVEHFFALSYLLDIPMEQLIVMLTKRRLDIQDKNYFIFYAIVIQYYLTGAYVR